MLDCQLYGLNPAGHHLTNVLLHAASSVLLFLVLLRMTGDLWPSAWVAAVFAIHPLHVESVAWVAERRDVLSGLFFMLTLLAYARYVERPSLARYLAVAGCLALGLMSKPMLVTVPFLLLLLDYWPLDRFRRAAGTTPQADSRSWLDRLPIWLAAGGGKDSAPGPGGGQLCDGPVDPRDIAVGRSCRPIVARDAPGQRPGFVRGLLWASLFIPSIWLPIILISAPACRSPGLPDHRFCWWRSPPVAVYSWRRRPYLLVGWLWFLGMLVPVIGLVQNGAHSRADRYTYLSQIGLSIALAWGVWSVYRSRQSLQAARWRGCLLAVVSAAAVLLLAAVAWRQTSYWRNAETLWTHTLSCTEQNLLAHRVLAGIYAERGRTEEAITHLREAVAITIRSIQIRSRSVTISWQSV